MSSLPPPQPHPTPTTPSRPGQGLSVAASLRQLLDSLGREQRRNRELLASRSVALRSYTNLKRFLERVPLVAARLGLARPCTLDAQHEEQQGQQGQQQQIFHAPVPRCNTTSSTKREPA